MNQLRKSRPVLKALFLMLSAVATALAGGCTPAKDTVIFTDGIKTGAVEGFEDGICTFDGAPVARTSIHFIGLAASLPPPSPQDPSRDEIHLHDGSIHPGPLISIDGATVVAATTLIPRKKVAWIWLTGAQPGPASSSRLLAASGPPAYEWSGTIKVENRYRGVVGVHLWRAEYRVRLLEVPTRSSRPGREIGVSFENNAKLEPLEFGYQIEADQTWDGQGYAVEYYAGVLSNGDVTMRGRATGAIGGTTLADSGVLSGELTRLPTPVPGSAGPTAANVATEEDYVAYLENFFSPREPGWYFISLGLTGHDMDHQGGTGPPARMLGVYEGIQRGGLQPPFFDDPYDDLVHWIPAYMTGLALVGRLDDPEQSRVGGALDFSRNVPPLSDPGERITITWSFQRSRLPGGP